MLRVGRLISGTLLVTDAMVLDGQYFMTLGPEGLLRALGANDGRFPLVITGPAATLRDGLEWRLRRQDFRWSLDGMEPGVEPPGRYVRMWEEWLRYVESGLIVYEPQDRHDPFELQLAPAAPDFGDGTGALIFALERVKTRSEAFALIETSILEPDAQREMKRWWNDRYLLALAQHLGADWLSFGATSSETGVAVGRSLRMPRDLVTWCKETSSAGMALAWDASGRQRDALRRAGQSTRRTEGEIRGLGYQATRVVSAPSRRGTIWDSVLRILLGIVAILLAVPAFEIAAFDSFFAWLLLGGVILTTVPWDSIWALVELFRPSPTARLVLYRRKDNA